ncbi:UNVERIFIED_CONTAM: ces-2 [Trichonephila clavipes]
MAPEKSWLSGKYTTKNSPTPATEADCIDTVVPDEPIDYSKKNTYIPVIRQPFFYYRMIPPVHPAPNSPEPTLMNNTSDLQPRKAHIMDPTTSQGLGPQSSIADRMIYQNGGKSFRNGNKSPPVTRKEQLKSWKDRNYFVEKVFRNRCPAAPFAPEVDQTIRRLEGQNTVGECSEIPLSANGRAFSEHKWKFCNTSLPNGRSARIFRQESPCENRHLMNAREQFSSGSFQGPMNHQRLISTPMENSLSESKRSRYGFTNTQYNHVSSNTQRRLSYEAPLLSSCSRENTSQLDPQSSNSFGEASSDSVPSSDRSSLPFSPPQPFSGLSPENPEYSRCSGSQLKAQTIVNGPLSIRPGLSITQQPSHPQNQLIGHDEEPNGASNTEGRAKRRKGQPVPEEEKDEKYLERRQKNNQAAKRSRDKRRERELQNIEKINFLTQANATLQKKVAFYQEMENRFRNLDSFICNPCFARLSSIPQFNPLSPPPQ